MIWQSMRRRHGHAFHVPQHSFVKVHGHNEYVTSLKAIMHFYNTRDVTAAKGPRSSPF
jgi:hypothetical protein